MFEQKDIDRFWSKIDKSGECWEWKAARDMHGYGFFKVGRKQLKAHRVSYMISVGEIPEGLFVCHRCDHPSCCNPEHLFIGDALANNRDAATKGHTHRAKGELNAGAKLTQNQVKDMLHLYLNERYTQAEIAQKFGVVQRTVSDILLGKKWRHIERPDGVSDDYTERKIHAGESNGQSKLSNNDVITIRDKYATGDISQEKLAREYGVSQHLISLIVRRINWKHIP